MEFGVYLLRAGPGQVDLVRFRRLVAEAAAARDDERAVAALGQAAGLWRGPALAGLDSPWLNAMRARLELERAGAYPVLIALIGLGIGAIIRHTAGAICALVGVLFVLPLVFISPSIQNTAQNFLPHPMAANSLSAVKLAPHVLPPGLTFSLLCAYAMAALAAGAWALTRRDA
jgi:hypothetical protein